MRLLFPPPDDPSHVQDLVRDVLLDDPAPFDVTDGELAELYAYPQDRRWVRVNMVAALDGVAAIDGVSAGLSSAPDRRVFRLLRALCDVVLVGASTARTEGYREAKVSELLQDLRATSGQTPVPPVAVVSRSLDLDPAGELFAQDRSRTIVLTCRSAPADRRAALAAVADVVDCGESSVDLATALDLLEGRGLRRVLCEGGPTLLHELAGGGHVDELCLTFSPLLAGGDRHLLAGPAYRTPVPLELASLLEEDGVLLGRYLRPDPASP